MLEFFNFSTICRDDVSMRALGTETGVEKYANKGLSGLPGEGSSDPTNFNGSATIGGGISKIKQVQTNVLSTIKESCEFKSQVSDNARHIKGRMVSGTGDNVYPYSVGLLAHIREEDEDHARVPKLQEDLHIESLDNLTDIQGNSQNPSYIGQANGNNQTSQPRYIGDSTVSPLNGSSRRGQVNSGRQE